MLLSDKWAIATSSVFGAIAGILIVDSLGAIIGGGIGATLAYLAARARIRPLVATTTIVGVAAGALIGSSIVETICLPASCVGLEIAGAVVLGLASLIGVGLVAALVTRSFDEYNESIETGRERTTDNGVRITDPDDPNPKNRGTDSSSEDLNPDSEAES
jgi:hypothetical protein